MKAIVKVGPFLPSVKVKILSKQFDPDFNTWRCECRVTSKTNSHYKQGEIIYPRYHELFLKEGVLRGTNGKCYWEGKPEFANIPLA